MHSIAVAPGSYEVRVRRETADATSGNTLDSGYWDVLQSELTVDGATTPIRTQKCRIVSLKVKAGTQLNGIVEDFNVVAKLHCRDYLGSGTGAARWRKRATRNPASALLYLLTDRKVNKKPVPNAKIQWDEFEAFHRWCAQKQFHFDAVISGDYTIGEIATMICTAGRVKLTRYNGTYGVQIERPSAAIDFQLTPRNTKGGMSLSKVLNAQVRNLACTFIDRTNGYVEVVRVCSIDASGTIHYDRPERERAGETSEITLVGVTDPDHAMKIAAFDLAKLNRRTIQYTVPQDWEQMTAFPGATGAWTGVELDTAVTMEAEKSYSLMTRMNDPAHGIRIYPLTLNVGTSTTLRFAAPVTQEIEAGNQVIFGEAGKEGIRVLCESIAQGSDDDGTLALVEYAEEIYHADSGRIPEWNPRITIPTASSHEPTYPLIEMVSDLQNKGGKTDAATPTYEDLASGYTYQGGGDPGAAPKATTAPTDVTLNAEGVYKGVVLRWDRQVNLTNLDRYEVQVSGDAGVSWYSLKFDGTDYKATLNAWTSWPNETLVHAGIPFGGTNDAPAGVALQYRVRRVTKQGVASSHTATSANAQATTMLIENSDIAAATITANKLDTTALQALVANITKSITIGDRTGFTGMTGSRTFANPVDGDRRMYLDRDEVHLERWGKLAEQFVVIKDQRTIVTSADGVTWTRWASGTVKWLYEILFRPVSSTWNSVLKLGGERGRIEFYHKDKLAYRIGLDSNGAVSRQTHS